MTEFIYANLNNIISFCITIVLTFLIARIAKNIFSRFLNNLDEKQDLDKTNYHFLRYVVIAIIYGIGFTLAICTIPALRAIGATLLAGAGVLALAVSFASQQALSNVVSGLFIVLFKPFKIKDRVIMKSKDLEGIIEDITLRHTVIRNYENKRIIVPNSVISEEVIINADYAESKICKHLIFGISYDSNIEKARTIIQEVAGKHPLTIDNRTKVDKKNNAPLILIRVINLGDSSIDLKAFVWVKNQSDAASLSSDLLERVKNRFDEEGIEIPFPHRKLVIDREQAAI